MSGATRRAMRRQLAVDAAKYGDHGAYYGMVQRVVRALGRRVAKSDPHDLAMLAALVDDLEEAIETAVAAQREAGFSWSEIGRGLAMSKQAAEQRWGDGR